MASLLEDGEVNPRNYANLYDKVQKNLGRPQRYGTQLAGNGKPYILENPEHLDEIRATMNLEPFAQYLKENRKFSKQKQKESEKKGFKPVHEE